MSDPITPDALRALAVEYDGYTGDGLTAETLRAAADRIEALTQDREDCRDEAWRLIAERDEAVALLRVCAETHADHAARSFLARLDKETDR